MRAKIFRSPVSRFAPAVGMAFAAFETNYNAMRKKNENQKFIVRCFGFHLCNRSDILRPHN
jgi:hypothetical protein